MYDLCLVHWHGSGPYYRPGERRSWCQRPAQADGLCEYHQRDKGAPGACRCDLDETVVARMKARLLGGIAS